MTPTTSAQDQAPALYEWKFITNHKITRQAGFDLNLRVLELFEAAGVVVGGYCGPVADDDE